MGECFPLVVQMVKLSYLGFGLIPTRINVGDNRQGRYMRELRRALLGRPAARTLNRVSFVKDIEHQNTGFGKWILRNGFWSDGLPRSYAF